MSTLSAALLVTSLLVVVGGTALWWVFNQGTGPDLARRAREERRLEHRLKNPDFAALESFYGGPVSPSLVALYKEPDRVLDRGFEVHTPEGKKWFVDAFRPADKESLAPVWPGCEGYFPFASTGSGDTYLVDPRVPDAGVLFYEHETGKKRVVAPGLSAFLAFPRKFDTDDTG
jgi:hypothetical protein